MIICTAEQRTAEWHQDRAGRLTGSVAADMLASPSTQAHQGLLARLVAERLTETPELDSYMNADMQRGIDLEPEARKTYEVMTGNIVEEVGFIQHDKYLAGCSVDGLLSDGIIEIKCPRPSGHLATKKAGAVPSKYIPQITHNLWVTGGNFCGNFCDYISYCPALPDYLQMEVIRVFASDLNIEAYEQLALKFLEKVETEVNFWRKQ
jgi:putative phage-type endonuclease